VNILPRQAKDKHRENSKKARFLFQYLLVDINAAKGAMHFRSFEGHAAAPYQFYTTSAARPADLPVREKQHFVLEAPLSPAILFETII
jgi:hypothetical protein